MQLQALDGRYDYRDAAGTLTGDERFRLETGEDGAWVLHSVARMAGSIRRDVTYVTDDALRPRECFVRIVADARFLGSAWFWFRSDSIGCVRLDPEGRRTCREHGLNAPVARFGTHAVVTDGWFAAGETLGARATYPVISVSEDGAAPPDLVFSDVSVRMVEDGVRTSTAAGIFTAQHWQIGFAEYPPLDVWLRTDDGLCVAQSWDLIGMRIELTELRALRGEESVLGKRF